jgi:hypothetical protein
LREARQDGLTLSLTYVPSAAERVRELVRKEQACCGFMHFNLRESESGIHLSSAKQPLRRIRSNLLEPSLLADIEYRAKPEVHACSRCSRPAVTRLRLLNCADGASAAGGRILVG